MNKEIARKEVDKMISKYGFLTVKQVIKEELEKYAVNSTLCEKKIKEYREKLINRNTDHEHTENCEICTIIDELDYKFSKEHQSEDGGKDE